MTFDPGGVGSSLCAAVGDDPALIADLQRAFAESADRAFVALKAAADRGSWIAAAARLKGLAASFGDRRLMALADQAVAAARPDPALVRKIRVVVRRL